ncbi:MAG: hypothetical protein VB120_07710 [Lachnospiraceae bacterium]|nr:hypothetical protein [Lachnospiraceae bacterium]
MENNFDNIELISELCKAFAPEAEVDKFIKDALLIKNLLDMQPKNDIKTREEEPKPLPEAEKPYINPYSPTKTMNILNAAIPYFNPSLGRSMYSAMRVFEIMRMASIPDIYMQSLSETNPHAQNRKMLDAIGPYLERDEKRNMEILKNMLEIKKLLSER